MIQFNTISDFNGDTDEGKMLLAAIAILTSIETKDIKSMKWGGMTHPDVALKQVQDLANKIYYEEEYFQYLKSKEREEKLTQIIDDENRKKSNKIRKRN